MPWVDWEYLGICVPYMARRLNGCPSSDRCGRHHPPLERVSFLWENQEAREALGRMLRRQKERKSQRTTQAAERETGATGDRSASAYGEAPRYDDRIVDQSPSPAVRKTYKSVNDEPLGRPNKLSSPILLPHSINDTSPSRNANIERRGRPDRLTSAVPAAAEATTTLPTQGVNNAPLGRPNRLLTQDQLKASSSYNEQEFGPDDREPQWTDHVLSSAARTIWKRTGAGDGWREDMNIMGIALPAQQETKEKEKENEKEKEKEKNRFWEKRKTQELTQTKSEVDAESARAPQPKRRDEADQYHMQHLESDASSSNFHSQPILATLPLSTTPLPTHHPHLPTDAMGGAVKRTSDGEPKSHSAAVIGPHPSTIKVATRYMTQAKIEKRLFGHIDASATQERSLAEAREDTIRLQGVTWIDQVRRSLQLPIRTYTTACVYYHNFRLNHPNTDYPWVDAAAASLLGSCKNEDTLKKSKDILAAAYNLKAPRGEHLGSDDVLFENPSKQVLGVERLMLESSCFDFRSKHPHRALIKIVKLLPESQERERVGTVAWTILTDLMRTFAMLKQTPQTLAFASLDLAAHLQAAASPDGASEVKDHVQRLERKKWSTSREEVMETLLDSLDLYTHHTAASILGTKYGLDDFLRIRLALNKECEEQNLPRYTTAPESDRAPLSDGAATLKVANGHPTPVSPPDPTHLPAPVQNPLPPLPEGGGTLRFVLNPQLAADEKEEVNKYFTEEWEEYEEEIEVPLPTTNKPSAPAAAAPSQPASARRDSGGAIFRNAPSGPGMRKSDVRDAEDGPRGPGAGRRLEERRSIDEMRERRAREDERYRERDRERDRGGGGRYEDQYRRSVGGGGGGRYDERGYERDRRR